MRFVLARMMTAMDLEFEKSMHYHDEEYECDNNYEPQLQVMIPVHIYLVFTTEASFNLGEYKETQQTISTLMPRQPESLAFCEGVCQHLTFDGMPPQMPEVDFHNVEYLLTADIDGLEWSEEPVPDRWEYLYIHKIPRPAILIPQPNQVDMPATPPLQPNQVQIPLTPSQKPGQVEMSSEHEFMELDIPKDMPDLIDVPGEVLSDFDAWAHSMCGNLFLHLYFIYLNEALRVSIYLGSPPT